MSTETGEPPTVLAAPPEHGALTGLSVLARAYLALAGGLALWAVLPLLLGWQASVVSSGSMSPSIPTGSILVTAPIDPARLRIGHVLLFDDPAAPGGLKSHRMVGTDPEGRLLTRGDANGSDDSAPVPAASVHGIGRLLVPAAGLPVHWARSGAYVPLLAWTLLTAVAVLVVRRTPRTRRPDRPRPTLPRLLAVGAGTVLLGVGGLQPAVDNPARPPVLGAVSAAFAGITRNPADSFAVDPAAQYGPSSYAAAVATDTPSLSWRLDQSAGPTALNSGSAGAAADGTYAATGITYQSAPDSTPREAGSAVTLNGTTGCIIGKQLVTNPQVFTIELWFRTTTTTGGRLMGFGNAATGTSTSYDRHLYMTNTGHIVFGIFPNAAVTIATTTAYNDGGWHLATASVGAAGMSLYLDGALVQTRAANTASQAYNGYWRVGCDNLTGWTPTPTSRFFSGAVDNAAVYPTQLTAARVAAHWYAA